MGTHPSLHINIHVYIVGICKHQEFDPKGESGLLVTEAQSLGSVSVASDSNFHVVQFQKKNSIFFDLSPTFTQMLRVCCEEGMD